MRHIKDELDVRASEMLMAKLIEKANRLTDGHVTILRFTTNWRVGFGTPSDRGDISRMHEGNTLGEAAFKALTSEVTMYDNSLRGV